MSNPEPNGDEEALFNELKKHFLTVAEITAGKDFRDSLNQSQPNIDALRLALTAGVSRNQVWAHTHIRLTDEIADKFLTLLLSKKGVVSEADIVGLSAGFATMFTSLIIVIAESGIDLSTYTSDPPPKDGEDSDG